MSTGSGTVTVYFMNAHPPAVFIADSPALDFLNSIATPTDTVIDWIADGAGLLSWLRQANLVPPEILQRLQAEARPGELDAVAAQARALREWFREFVLRHKGRPLGVRDLQELEPLNKLLQRDEAFYQIIASKEAAGELRAQLARRWRSPDSLLLPMGETLAQFVSEEHFSDIKACEGDHCTLMFADHTRARARRWCSMGVCGNRAKVAAHRQRHKMPHGAARAHRARTGEGR